MTTAVAPTAAPLATYAPAPASEIVVKEVIVEKIVEVVVTATFAAIIATPTVDDLIHVGEIIERQKEVSRLLGGQWNEYLSTVEIEYRGWSEETVVVQGPYSAGSNRNVDTPAYKRSMSWLTHQLSTSFGVTSPTT